MADPTAALLREVFTDEQIAALWEASRHGFGALGAANSKLALALTASDDRTEES